MLWTARRFFKFRATFSFVPRCIRHTGAAQTAPRIGSAALEGEGLTISPQRDRMIYVVLKCREERNEIADKAGTKQIAVNRQARHEYFVIEALETGIELVGTEVKSLRAGAVNLKDSWVDVDNGQLILRGMHISPYDKGNVFNRDPLRERRLLAHKSEIRRLGQEIKLQGYTLVPLSLYFKRGRVKVELGVCKGKKLYDKRASAAAKDAQRTIDRAMKTQRY